MNVKLTTGVVLTAFLLGGCASQSRPNQARADAHRRLDAINAALHFEQAESAFEVGQFEKALSEIDSAIAGVPQQADWYVLKARILLEMTRLEPASNTLDMALELNPELPEAHYYAGIAQQRWSNDQAALEHYQAAFEADQQEVQYLLAAAESMVALQMYRDAKMLVEDWLVHFENNAALRHLLAQVALLEGNAELAVELYTDARRLTPDDESLQEELARAQFAAGQFGKCYESVMRLQRFAEEQRADLILIEARCLSLMGRSLEARTAYLDATMIDPANADAWIELGALAWELNDFSNVAMSGARASQLAPNRPEGYLLKAVNELHKGRTAQAQTLLKQAADRAPNLALPHLLLGQLHEEAGDFNLALSAYEAAMDANPDSREAIALHTKLNKEVEVWAAEDVTSPLD